MNDSCDYNEIKFDFVKKEKIKNVQSMIGIFKNLSIEYSKLSMDKLRDFILWFLHNSHHSDDICHVFLWCLIPQIIRNPKERKLRDLISCIVSCAFIDRLLPFLILFAFQIEEIRTFIHLIQCQL